MAKSDYYEILGVSKSATADEIKRAYRKLAAQHHPDKSGGDEAKFKEVSEAYEVLKDPQKRQRYDQFGHAGAQGFGGGGGGAGYGPFGGFGGQQVDVDFGDIDLGDIFGSFFGGGGRRQSRAQERRGRDVETSLTLDFKDSVFGVEKSIELELEDNCPRCEGKMAEPGSSLKSCPTCHGSGQVVENRRTILGTIQHASVCPECHGRGQIPEKPCSECHGKGVKRKKQKIKLKIPAGIKDGEIVRLRGRGEAIAGGAKGDLYVRVRVRADKRFQRQGHDILSEEAIGMADAALGTELEVQTVDGETTMKVPSGTQSGQTFKISGKGIPYSSGNKRGDHLVKINVEIPKKLTGKQKQLLEELRDQQKRKWL